MGSITPLYTAPPMFPLNEGCLGIIRYQDFSFLKRAIVSTPQGGVIWGTVQGTTIGVIQGDTRTLECG